MRICPVDECPCDGTECWYPDQCGCFDEEDE